MTELSARVIREDRKLEDATERSREALARHRWHWTLDESNAGRVSISEYARQVGRGFTTVRDMVTGYGEWSHRGAPIDQLAEYIERAKLRGDTLAATEAVAEAKGITIGTARRHHAEEIRKVTDSARERVERATEPTTLADEARTIAKGRMDGANARKRIESERRKSHSAKYFKIEGYIATARREVLAALAMAQDVQFTDDEREMLTHAADDLRAILSLLDLAIVNSTDVDWDTELAKLTDQ